jgi:hypothetical protein
MKTCLPIRLAVLIKKNHEKLLSIFIFLFCATLILFLLTNYSHTWTQPEEFNWRENILKDGGNIALRDVRRMFDWESFEYVPRTTRPLSSLIEIIDTKFRVWLWHWIVPHPSLSLTWILMLWINPLLFYRLLRSIGTRKALSLIIISLYLVNPATLSLVAVNFRPSKPIANFAILMCLYIASSINRRSSDLPDTKRLFFKPETGYYFLCMIMFVSFFFDETAVVSYAAVPLFFPKVVFRGLKRILSYAVLPPATGLCYFKLFPLLSTLAGYPSISIFSKIRDSQIIQNHAGPAVNTVGAPSTLITKAWGIITDDVLTNIKIFLSDSFGLVNPALSNSFLYKFLWSGCTALLVVMAVLLAIKILRRGEKIKALVTGIPYTVGIASAVALSAVTLFANALLHVVDNHVWGLHWLSTFWAIFFYILIAVILNNARFNHVFIFIAAVFIMSASYYNFIYVNNAFKMFFYYRTFEIKDIWKHKVNRFQIPIGNSTAYYNVTRFIWKEHGKLTVIQHIPTELYYLVHDLRLIKPGTSYTERFSVFDGHVNKFSLVKQNLPPKNYFTVVPEN